jgi:hypothetical protein
VGCFEPEALTGMQADGVAGSRSGQMQQAGAAAREKQETSPPHTVVVRRPWVLIVRGFGVETEPARELL